MDNYKNTPYEESYFCKDVMQAGERELYWLKKYTEGMLRAQRGAQGHEYLRYFFKQAHSHVMNRIVSMKYKHL